MAEKRAWLDVHDKTDLITFAEALIALRWEIFATGSTGQRLRAAGVEVAEVEAWAAEGWRDRKFDLVAVNLMPFADAVRLPGVTVQSVMGQVAVEGVDILRAAARDFAEVIALGDPADYGAVLEHLQNTGDVPFEVRRHLAAKVFRQTRDYDAAVHAYLSGGRALGAVPDSLPETVMLVLNQVWELRHGENPHQRAVLYGAAAGAGPLGGEHLGGRSPTWTSLLDMDAAWRLVTNFEEPAVALVKARTPAGAAVGWDWEEALRLALGGHPERASRAVWAVNGPVDQWLIRALGDIYPEAVIAPSFNEQALADFERMRPHCTLLQMPDLSPPSGVMLRSVIGGVAAQLPDVETEQMARWRVMGRRRPSVSETEALYFAWRVIPHVRAYAAVVALGNVMVGVGSGQPTLSDSVRLAVEGAGERSNFAVLAVGHPIGAAEIVEMAAAAGIRAVAQPGGSLHDEAVISAADDADIAMAFTGVQHFRA